MCGIVGILQFDGQRPDAPALDRALESLHRRGPDGVGHWQDEAVALGHRRLAVIDLTESAGQPMVSHDGRHVIVFNGEIYNYRELRAELGDYPFRTQSDTETMLAAYAAWGVDFVNRLRGMFAFAIWDRERRELFLARDRLGVKPLFFSSGANHFAFASRPKALLALLPHPPRTINRQALRWYIESGYVPAPLSIFEGINKLQPGCRIIASQRGAKQHRYWAIDNVEPVPALARRSEAQLLDELDALIERSVRWRMVSNVPVGAFLSGGIDSSLVVAHMRRLTGQSVKTFTIGFDDQAFDESSHAAAVAAHLGTEHNSERLSAKDLLDLMPIFFEEFDEPFFDYSAFPLMAVSRLARREVKVVLSGDGGDEAFGGYHYYRIAHALAPAFAVPRWLRVVASQSARCFGRGGRLLSGALSESSRPRSFAFSRSVIKESSSILAASLINDTSSMGDLFEATAAGFPPLLSSAEQGMRLDIAHTLPDDYLQKVDLSTMAFSLEAREPLLDHSILEWAARLPLSLKLRGSTNKYLLRKLAYRYVPKRILDRPKQGFGLPMASWLRGPLRSWGVELLEDTEILRSLELEPTEVRRLWDRHQGRGTDAHTILWTILVLLQFTQTLRAVAAR